MSLIVWIIALVVLFFIARAWLQRRAEDDGRIAGLVPPPHSDTIEVLEWPVVGETQMNADHTSRQQALAQCVEGMPVDIDFHHGGPGAASTARVITEHGEIGTLRKDAIDKMDQLRRHHQKVEAFILSLEGGTEEHRIRSATLQIYVYKDKS
jgi:hypothetical protein